MSEAVEEKLIIVLTGLTEKEGLRVLKHLEEDIREYQETYHQGYGVELVCCDPKANPDEIKQRIRKALQDPETHSELRISFKRLRRKK